MGAKLRHIAIVSDQYALLGRFYEAAFGMRTAQDRRADRAVTVSDGYVGLNINPRKAGRPAGLDHFGVEVDDADAVCAKLAKHGVNFVKRPATRPFAGITAHDPAGNLFDISQNDMENRKSVYVEAERQQPRYVTRLAIRTLHVGKLKAFYEDVLGLADLTDGRVTLQLIPWDIRDFEGSGVVRPGPDHIGFKVESLAAFKEHLAAIGENNPHLRTQPLGGKEGAARAALFARSARGAFQFADPDGTLVDVSE